MRNELLKKRGLILTSPSSFGKISAEPFRLLIKAGFNYINNPYGRKLTEDEVINLAKYCVGIIAGVEPLTAKVMDALPQLKCISRVGVGMDSVDLEYAKMKGIVVVNTPDGPTRSVAELTIAMTFSLLRRIPQADCAMKKKQWKKQIGNLLQNKTVGVIGLGRIGKMVVEMFMGLGNTVIGCDLYPDKAWCKKHGVEICDFNEILAKADIITLHIPGNKDKTAVIGKNEIDLMKNGAFLVNIARGGVVDEEALFNALKTNKLSGAAVDVFSQEPYSGPLWELENIVLTPHLGSYTEEGKLQMEIDAVINLINVLK
jgi:D-3-phosphoglycerate dehydrogenase